MQTLGTTQRAGSNPKRSKVAVGSQAWLGEQKVGCEAMTPEETRPYGLYYVEGLDLDRDWDQRQLDWAQTPKGYRGKTRVWSI